ncbi:MAG: UvrB/UvrC motif-containing protein [Oscillospiraceae bacterium]|nr:UvrB/UvrC motif-containing protein [Oscillospiraceae bacterium]
MLCQICGINEATTHLKRNINGNKSEQFLCSACAKEHEGGFSLSLPDVFQGLFGAFNQPAAAAKESRRCPKCAMSFGEIAHLGKVGCADCYRTFYDQLESTIQRIHGRSIHASKPPAETPQDRITKKKAQLQEAIQVQNFELAAQLRDEIKALEGGGEGK